MKLPADLDSVCARACVAWGQQSQEDVAIGELGELLTLFGRRPSGRATEEQWVDEIADVIIMAHQLAYLHGGMLTVEARIAEKLPKLAARINHAVATKITMHDSDRELYVDAIKSCRTLSDDMMASAEKHGLIARHGFEKEKWNWNPLALRALSTPQLRQAYIDLKSVV